MKNKLLLTLVYIALIVTACKKDKAVEAVDIGYNYFPVEVGRYVVYQVDSISYNDFFTPVKIDTAHFQLKEVIESVFTDNEGRESERIERYVRYADTLPWSLRDVWYQTRSTTKAEKVEENVRFIRLTFPTRNNQKWNGNALNTIGTYSYEYKSVDTKKTVNGNVFDSTLTVNQILDSNLIEKKYQVEIYAKNVGMIYKRFVDVQDKGITIEPGPLSNRIDAGTDYTYRIIEYGKQ
ncbi:MAG TPA: hypothetical protein PLN13_06600 [Bacteroidia bacterium]|nr:hypothetical protein [Bacteroidia bacterium]HRH08234.1 hypothetical protein [Bacteroidia bacterium]